MDLNELLIFTRVVEAGSFTAGARLLAMPKSSVSRKIAELEDRLAARLLQRTTRKLGLTDAGRVYYEHCARIVAAVAEAEQAVLMPIIGPWQSASSAMAARRDCICVARCSTRAAPSRAWRAVL